MVPQSVTWNKREAAEGAAEEVGAELGYFVKSLRITREASRRGVAVKVPICLRRIGPGIGDVRPVIRAPRHRLVAIGVPGTELDRVKPVGVEIILTVASEGPLGALAILEVIHDRTKIIVVRIGKAARRLVDVGRITERYPRIPARRVERSVRE